jgi:hypothetical protein
LQGRAQKLPRPDVEEAGNDLSVLHVRRARTVSSLCRGSSMRSNRKPVSISRFNHFEAQFGLDFLDDATIQFGLDFR